jgi:hypothetical protein
MHDVSMKQLLRRVRSPFERASQGRAWWAWLLGFILLSGAGAKLPSPWPWVVAAAFLFCAFLIFDGHARWQRDQDNYRI